MVRYSNCCGAAPIGQSEEMERCPECKEHCSYEDENDSHLEYITVKMPKFRFMAVVADLRWIANVDYTVKEIDPNDGKFDNDPTDQELKRLSNKAYKQWKEYRWKVRNK
jgi:hypothetical protein